jgi:hypothetical protein
MPQAKFSSRVLLLLLLPHRRDIRRICVIVALLAHNAEVVDQFFSTLPSTIKSNEILRSFLRHLSEEKQIIEHQ